MWTFEEHVDFKLLVVKAFLILLCTRKDARIKFAGVDVEAGGDRLQQILNEQVDSFVNKGVAAWDEVRPKPLECLQDATVQRHLVPGEPEPLNKVARLLLTKAGVAFLPAVVVLAAQIAHYGSLLVHRRIVPNRFEVTDEDRPLASFEALQRGVEVCSNHVTSAQARPREFLLDETPQ